MVADALCLAATPVCAGKSVFCGCELYGEIMSIICFVRTLNLCAVLCVLVSRCILWSSRCHHLIVITTLRTNATEIELREVMQFQNSLDMSLALVRRVWRNHRHSVVSCCVTSRQLLLSRVMASIASETVSNWKHTMLVSTPACAVVAVNISWLLF
jgi:hypothetical protein